jgi:hypothetical protein
MRPFLGSPGIAATMQLVAFAAFEKEQQQINANDEEKQT